MLRRYPPDKERFWQKVEKTDTCWNWTAYRSPLGYGAVRFDGRPQQAHRVAWQLAYGPIPDGMDVCHRCDNRACVNAEHLFLGTALDNVRDMMKKGRGVFVSGERSGASKLSTRQVRLIRELADTFCMTQTKIGKLFRVKHCTIGNILRGDTWRAATA